MIKIPLFLKEIYVEVAEGRDSRMFADVVTLLALNHNAPPELLNAIYKKTVDSNLSPLSRDRKMCCGVIERRACIPSRAAGARFDG